jgi:hypothetical protein
VFPDRGGETDTRATGVTLNAKMTNRKTGRGEEEEGKEHKRE